MVSHDAKRSPTENLSRRTLLAGAATAGAASLAVTAIGAAASPAMAATSPRGQAASLPGEAASLPSGPIVVHVRDAKSGDIEVLAGTSSTRLRDKDLAARIARIAG